MSKIAFTFRFKYTPEGSSEVKETGLVDIPTASIAGIAYSNYLFEVCNIDRGFLAKVFERELTLFNGSAEDYFFSTFYCEADKFLKGNGLLDKNDAIVDFECVVGNNAEELGKSVVERIAKLKRAWKKAEETNGKE